MILSDQDEYGFSWTHVKEISGTKLLISIQQNITTSANIEVFNLASKRRSEKVCSFDEVIGCKFSKSIY